MLWRVAVWMVAIGVTLVVAAFSSIGPVLWVVRPGNGLHVTDVAFGFVACGIALVITVPRQPRD